MAHELTMPFYAFRLHLHNGGSLLAPLNDREVIRVREKLPVLAGQYTKAFQKNILNKGQISELLSEYQRGHFIPAKIKVSFPASKDKISYPAFDLEFVYYFNQEEPGEGIWAIVPALDLEAYAVVPESLEQQLTEAIQLDFARFRRLHAVQDIVSAIWYGQIELKQHPITLQIPSPRELEQISNEQQEKLLPEVGTALKVNRPASFGRDKELQQLAHALTGSFQKNTLLIGPSGAGKTALVWELARQQKQLGLKGRIWETTASVLIKELMKETGWQENLSQLCRELSGQPDILFIRNLMDLFEVGKYEGNTVSIAEYLLPYLSRGEVTMVTECTEDELARIEIKSPSYLNIFQRIVLSEPKGKDLENIIFRKATDLAEGQKVRIETVAIREAIRLSRRFSPYDGMPGRPIRFLENLFLNRRSKAAPGQQKVTKPISRSDILVQFCEETGMPRFIIDPDIPMVPEELLKHFNDRVFGQEKAVEQISGVLAAVKTALSRTGKPIASLLFVGPTGVGKTELAKQLASFMFGHPDRMTRFDMSEFSTPMAVQRLLGQHYFSEGLLTSAVRKAPFGILLFDEIEKADPAFFDLLLQMLSEGRLTDSRGQLVNFCSTIIIMTSNVGAANLKLNPIGWQKEQTEKNIEAHFRSAVQKYFRPELFNRIDQVIPFAPLDNLTIRYVLDREVQLLKQREGIRFRKLHLDLTPSFLDYLATKGYDKQYGARHLQRTLRQELILPLAQILNQQDIDDQLEVVADHINNQPHFSAKADPLGLDLLLEEYTKITYTDHASSLRRAVEKLMEGGSYVQMLSELDMLAATRKRKGKGFWDHKESAERYGKLLEEKTRMEALARQTEQLELQLSMACLQIQHYQPDWTDELEAVEEQLSAEKINIYELLYPNNDECLLFIPGEKTERPRYFYLELIEGLPSFEVRTEAAWASGVGHSLTMIRLVPHDWAQGEPQPENGGPDRFLGTVLRISGQGAFIFFEPENGVQSWHLEPDEPQLFQIIVAKNLDTLQQEIAKSLNDRLPTARREIKETTIRDFIFDIKREYHGAQLPQLISDSLERQFYSTIDSIIG